MYTPPLVIAWTTVAQHEDALRLSRAAVRQHLVACAQIDGPIESIYTWSDQVEEDREYRVTFKLVEGRLTDLEAFIANEHPYDTPEFVAVRATRTSEKYLNWANQSSS
jgi:periplasmic divalent cation tolerance protein